MARVARLLTSVALIFFLTAPPIEAKLNPLPSVRALQILDEEGVFQAFCSAWKTRLADGRHVWATAAHCLPPPDYPEKIYISGVEVTPLMYDGHNDLGAYIGGPAAPPLNIAFSSPKPGQQIYGIGYPHASDQPYYVAGVWSITKDWEGMAVYGLPVAHGMSGGPVLDDKSVVVGVFQQTECSWMGWCPTSRGVSTETLRKFLGFSF